MSNPVAELEAEGRQHIPTLPAELMPMFAYDGENWRARMDEVREKHAIFRLENDPAVWFTRYDAAQEICSRGDLFWEGVFDDNANVAGAASWQTESVSDQESAAAGVREHIRLRQILMSKLNPRTASTWEQRMHDLSVELIDRFADKGECDYVHEFAKIYFPYIGAEMIGAPREDWDQLVEWEHEVFKVPAERSSVILSLDNPTMTKIVEYVHELMGERRRNPDDSFVSYVMQALDAGEITLVEARWACTILVLGSGHTVSSHLGYLMEHFATHPEDRQRILDDPETINTTCEELLRLYSFGGHQRTVTTDIEDFHGVSLKKGEKVYMLYPAVNRDPQAGLDTIDLDRKVGRHLAFNQGWRQCIGMHFARRARNIAIAEWHKRIPHYQIKAGTKLVEQIYAGVGYHNLPLVW